MFGLLSAIAVGLALAGVLTLVLLAVRRSFLVRAERRREQVEGEMRPIAIAIVEGDGDPPPAPTRLEARALASILSRYSASLKGESEQRIARYFEGVGAVDAELERLAGRRSWRRAGAAFALGDMCSAKAVPALGRALHDPERDVRAAAARSLGRLRAEESVEDLVGALAEGTVPRAVAGQALISIGDRALPALRKLLGDDDADVRRAAAEIIGLVGGPGDLPVVEPLLHDPAAEVRAAGARVMGHLGGPRQAEQLTLLLDDRIPFVRTAAARALGAIGDPGPRSPLLAQAFDDLYDPAQAAAEALALLDPEWARDRLRLRANAHLSRALGLSRGAAA